MMAKSLAENIAESQRAGVDLLITDAKSASIFLDLAKTTDTPELRTRRIEHALRAYRTILHFLPRLYPTARQMRTLTAALEKLRARLKAFGIDVDKIAPSIDPPV